MPEQRTAIAVVTGSLLRDNTLVQQEIGIRTDRSPGAYFLWNYRVRLVHAPFFLR
jgi:hypothetical protein